MIVKPDQHDFEFTGYLEESKENEQAVNNKSVDEVQILNIDEYVFYISLKLIFVKESKAMDLEALTNHLILKIQRFTMMHMTQ